MLGGAGLMWGKQTLEVSFGGIKQWNHWVFHPLDAEIKEYLGCPVNTNNKCHVWNVAGFRIWQDDPGNCKVDHPASSEGFMEELWDPLTRHYRQEVRGRPTNISTSLLNVINIWPNENQTVREARTNSCESQDSLEYIKKNFFLPIGIHLHKYWD